MATLILVLISIDVVCRESSFLFYMVGTVLNLDVIQHSLASVMKLELSTVSFLIKRMGNVARHSGVCLLPQLLG